MLDRILIIDDFPEVENVIRFCSHSFAPNVTIEIYDPQCGMPERNFDWGRYDLLLLDYDLGLENQNGLYWLAVLKEQFNIPPIILFTSYSSQQLEAEAHRVGADDYLNKDIITPELFFDRVKKVLMSAQTRFTADKKDDEEKTRLLSLREKRDSMNTASSLPAEDNDNYDKTVLFNRDEMPVAPAEEDSFDKTVLLTSQEVSEMTNAGKQALPVEDPPQLEAGADKNAFKESRPQARPPMKANTRRAQPRPQAASEIPIEVPGYDIKKKIGQGGMASIYLAEREEDRLKVVLKVLTLDEKGEAGLLRRFMREYKLIGQIQHPNIVQIHERAFASDFAYIAMEYFSHGDLAERLKTGVDGKTAVSYLHQIAEGLGAAHAIGIIHRDMKPANILFRSKDELAVTDFGIAKSIETENKIKQGLTMAGELMGTLYYISPEQIQDIDADQRSDLYSLGVIMYKMLTNRHPYVGASPMDVFEGHLSAPIPKLPAQFSSLQPLLDGLLCKDPDERFQSTEDLLMGLNWKEWA